jgi:uncharacterized protein YndB with AHSA1/START domain
MRPEIGGEIRFEWNIFDADRAASVEIGRIVEATPDVSLAFEWQGHGVPTRVRFKLEKQDQRTLLHVSESGPANSPDDEKLFTHLEFGWKYALGLLKQFLETQVRLV